MQSGLVQNSLLQGWFGVELSIARPLQGDLGLEFAVTGCLGPESVIIAEQFGLEFAVAGWVGVELFIERPLQGDLGLEFAVAGCWV